MEIGVCLITQARTGSTRLPGKVLKKIEGEELLKIHLTRLSKCKTIDKIIVATTTENDDVLIENLVKSWNYDVFRGSENDVLDRFYQAIAAFNVRPQWVVRVTSDCPLLDPALVDEVVKFAQEKNVDYASNVLIERFPDGQDVEVFKFSALETAWKNASLKSEREHVTPYIRNNSDFKGGTPFTAANYPCAEDFSKIRMTVDEEKDFLLVKNLIEQLGTDKTWLAYTNFIIENNLDNINGGIIRNEGYLKSINNE
ncbi:cytidylyltransferase domain-containing protein [Emticicia agri]|uniref:cytidylyltransferase domain-containing protein n=1 Tax=Emticicia agri TaxID=2492393 RepID=UPI001A92D750|nr:glycosyltransferase family protein [Emticicia agri]